ncbi:hypothetical protein PMJ10TS2_46240 [Paenibacillus melissococcoides]
MRDPIFDDIPWDIITDEAGRVIGTVYILLPDPPPRRRQKERRGRITPSNRTYIRENGGMQYGNTNSKPGK